LRADASTGTLDAVNHFRGRRGAMAIPIYAVFAGNGLLFATWVSRLPAVRERLDATEPQLGAVLLCIAVGSLVSMPATAWLCDCFGARRVLITAVVACAAAFQVAVVAPSLLSLGVALLFVGATYGMWDVAMNASGHVVECALDRPLMPGFHGAFSVGGLVGAGLGAVAAAVGVAPWAHTAVVAVVVAVVGTLMAARVLELPPAPAPAPAATGVRGVGEGRRRTISTRLVLIGLLTACITMGEGAAADWGGLFLHDERGTTEATAAVGYAVFSCAMAVGRFGGTWALARIGRVRALQVSGVTIGVALAALVSIEVVPVALVAMAGWGLGVALVFPAAMSAAAEHATRPAQGIAVVATIGYCGFLVGPPLIGFLAGQVGLGGALWVVAALGGVLIALSPAAAPAHRTMVESEQDLAHYRPQFPSADRAEDVRPLP